MELKKKKPSLSGTMKRKLYLGMIAAVFLIGFLGISAAQTQQEEIDTAIVVSTANYPDAMISSSPSEKLGIPVLLTERTELSESTSQIINNQSIQNVILVGGPAVISEDVEAQIQDIKVNQTEGTKPR